MIILNSEVLTDEENSSLDNFLSEIKLEDLNDEILEIFCRNRRFTLKLTKSKSMYSEVFN